MNDAKEGAGPSGNDGYQRPWTAYGFRVLRGDNWRKFAEWANKWFVGHRHQIIANEASGNVQRTAHFRGRIGLGNSPFGYHRPVHGKHDIHTFDGATARNVVRVNNGDLYARICITC